MADKSPDEHRGFCWGVAVTLAILARHLGQPSMALDILGEIGMTTADLRAAGVEDYDMEPLEEEERANDQFTQ